MPEPTLTVTPGLASAVQEIEDEHQRQRARWGHRTHLDGTGTPTAQAAAEQARSDCDSAHARGHDTWAHILDEHVWKVYADSDPAALRADLVQVAAVCAAWIADLDTRGDGS